MNDVEPSATWPKRPGREWSRRRFLAGTAGAALVGTYGWVARPTRAIAADAADGDALLSSTDMLTEVSDGVYAPILYTSNLALSGDFSKWQSYTGIVLPANSKQNMITGWSGNADLSAEAHFAYDEANFYLAVKVTDDVHHSLPGGTNFDGDGLQFAFGDLVNTSTHTEYGVDLGPAGPDIIRYSDGMAPSPPDSVEMKFTQSGTDILYELRIPWTAAMASAPPASALVPFTLLVNDNDGASRRGWIEWTPGIGNSKNVGQFARAELLPQQGTWTAWIAGETTVDSGVAVQFALYVPNFGTGSTDVTVDIPVAGVAAQRVSIPAGQTLKKTFTLTMDSSQDIVATVTNVASGDSRTLTHHVDAVKTAAQLNAMFDDLGTVVLPRLSAQLQKATKAGIATDYEVVQKAVVERFIQYGRDDVDHDRRDRAGYIASTLYALDEDAEANLTAYLAGSKSAPVVPRFRTGKTTIDGYSLIGDTDVESERPFLFTGYGMFGQIKEDIPNFPDFGTSIVDYNLGPVLVIDPPAPFPHWYTYSSTGTATFELDTTQPHTGKYSLKFASTPGENYVTQSFPVQPNTTYTMSLWIKGTDVADAALISKQWGYVKGLPGGTYDWQQATFQIDSGTATSLGFMIQQTGSSTIWIDDARVVAVGGTTNVLENGGFEAGPNTADFDVNTSSITSDILPMESDAEQHNIAINFDLAIHYWPTWTYQTWPDIRNSDNLFANTFDIEHPKTIEILQAYLDAVVPMIKDSPALQSVTLSSEPIYFKNNGAYHLAHWRTWLKQRFATVQEMNTLYGTSYTSFDVDAVPDMDNVVASPLYYDYLSFKTDRFTEFHKMLADRVHMHAPNLPTHIKFMGWGMLNRAPRLTWGIDPEAFSRITELNGDDDGNAQESGPQGYLNLLYIYDMQSSMKKQPVFNSEDHVITDGDERYIPSIAKSVGNSIWSGALHGRSASTIWVWERSYDTAGQGYLQGSILNRPDAVVEVGHVSFDLNRLAYQVTAFQDAQPKVAILQSFVSNLYSDTYFGTMQDAYASLSSTGQKVGFVTDREIAAGDLDSYALLVLPETTHVTAKTLRAIKTWVTARRGRIVAIGSDKTLLARDEYDKALAAGDRAPVLRSPWTTYVASNPSRAQLRDVFFGQATRLRIQDVVVYDAATNQPAEDIEWRTATYQRRKLLSVINFTESDKQLYVKEGNARVRPARELISGASNSAMTLAVKGLGHYIYELR